MRRITVLFTSFLALTAIQLHGEQSPPTLRLPDTAAPTGYNVRLSLDPAKPTFSGEVSIKLNIKQPTQMLWLNGTQLEVQSARLIAGDKTYDAKATPSGDDFIGFQFDSQ